MALSVVTAATSQILSLIEVQESLRLSTFDSPSYFEGLIGAATAQLEAATQRRFLTQTLDWTLNGWSSELVIPVAPVASVTSVKYRDADNVERTLSASQYVVYSQGQATRIRAAFGTVWPDLSDDAVNAVTVRFVVGGSTAAASVKQAALVYIHMMHDNPTLADVPMAPSGLPVTVENLIASERWS